MINVRLEQIEADAIASLVESRMAESTTLEFKAALPDKSDRGVFEFLKDVCAMANSGGGDIVYGLSEVDGVATAVQPISDETEDKALLRLGQMLDAGIEPRLSGTRYRTVPMDGGYLLIVRVQQSLSGPHRVNRQGQQRFPFRNERHVSDMSYDQLRTAFDRQASLAEGARRFRAARMDGIRADVSTGRLTGAGALVVHVMPLASFGALAPANLQAAKEKFLELLFGRISSANYAFNLDGLLAYSSTSHAGVHQYTQLFRSGAVELFRSGYASQDQHGRNITYGPSLTCDLRSAVRTGLRVAREFSVPGGAFVGVAVLGVHNRKLSLGSYADFRNDAVADRDELLLREVWTEDVDESSVDTVSRPLLDTVWQSFGLERCGFYDQSGNFNADTRYD